MSVPFSPAYANTSSGSENRHWNQSSLRQKKSTKTMLMLPPPSVAIMDRGYLTPPPSASPSITTFGSSSTSTLNKPSPEASTDCGISVLSGISPASVAVPLPQPVTTGPPRQRRSWKISYENMYIISLILAACFIIMIIVLPIFRHQHEKPDNGAVENTPSTNPNPNYTAISLSPTGSP